MNLKSNHTLVKRISQSDNLLTGVMVNGYFDNATDPLNYGVVVLSDRFDKGDFVNWMRIDNVDTPSHSIVNSNEIFCVNGRLIKSGVLVKRHAISQSEKLIIRTQDFFIVVQSNDPSISEKSVIIAIPNTCYRTIINDEEYYFVHSNNVALIVDSNQYQAGPSYRMFESYIERSDLILFDDDQHKIAKIDGDLVYFKKSGMTININSKKYVLVHEKDILGYKTEPRTAINETCSSA